MLPPTSSVLFEDREILVLHRPGRSDHTLVTFADLTFRPAGHAFWGREAAEKLDLDTIGFVAKRENWFPVASVEAAAPAVRKALKPRSIGYGYSMGAYAALKHGRRLGLGGAIAVAPQVSISPTDVPWDTRFHRFHRPVPHQGMAVTAADLAPFTTVLADPYDPTDWHHAQLAAQAGGVHLLRTPLVGHFAIWLLAGSGALAEILPPALASDVAAMHAVLRARRARSGHWFRLMGRSALRLGHARLPERLWHRAVELGIPAGVIENERTEAMADRAHRLAVEGRREEAAAICRQLAALAGDGAGLIGRVAHILLHAGAAPEAEVAFRRAVAGRPTAADLHIGLSLALAAQQRHREAIEAARRGHAALPLETDLTTHLGHMLIAGGRAYLPEAETVFREVLQRRPATGQALHGLSIVLARRNEIEEALALARKAAYRMPGSHDVQAWLARLLSRSGDTTGAEQLFRRIVAEDPLRPEGHVGLSEVLAVVGRREEAVAAVEQGLAALPGNPALLAQERALAPRFPGLAGRLRRLFRARDQ
ncbi:tetratricopeptide repeat protein [Neoroseomonas soli]|uniref:Tetratricopeptide repeat protein n=1 Tax=Neoroseomonas soli TaxID=1081025 RepID=A0A9X9X2H2_9PROT|nr:tetratricopeptide repeat protein [Neoroseomonas soli]MBR0673601.1 tetratricopeptide repeat protein [Neoroseomonas soli]